VANRRKYSFADLIRWLALSLGGVTIVAGCGTTDGGYARARAASGYRSSASGREQTHTVAPGETVYRIARRYGVSPDAVMAANGIADARNLAVGEILVIPGHPLAEASITGLPDEWTAPRADRQFAWPVVAGTLSSPFGMRGGVMHEGIDIAAPAGTPIHAADEGSVIFAGRLHGYGNVVIVQHDGGYVTVYGHNQRNLVREGQRVSRGEEIAELGATGRASGPNLHFEVRYNNRPQNPISYLPEPGPSTGISFARNAGY
jgi:lipoprotein NlpD